MKRSLLYAIALVAICIGGSAFFASRYFAHQSDVALIQTLAKNIFIFQVKYQEMAVRDENANGVGEYAYFGSKEEPFARPTTFQGALMDSYASLLSGARSNRLGITSMTPFVDATGRVIFTSKKVDEERKLSTKEKEAQQWVSAARWCVRITNSDSGAGWFVIGGGTIVGYGIWEEQTNNMELSGPTEEKLLDLGERTDFGFDLGERLVFRWK